MRNFAYGMISALSPTNEAPPHQFSHDMHQSPPFHYLVLQNCYIIFAKYGFILNGATGKSLLSKIIPDPGQVACGKICESTERGTMLL